MFHSLTVANALRTKSYASAFPGGDMQRTEQCVRRLLDELAAARRATLRRDQVLDEALRRAEGLAELADSRPARGAARSLLADLRGLRAELSEAAADRLRACTDRADELREAIARHADLSRLGELSASVAHEIRNPLCGILLSVEVLQTKMDPDDSRGVLLENLHREAQKMEKVVNNLLHFARHYKPRPAPCRMEELVRRSIESVSSHLRKRKVEVSVSPCGADCEAEVDPQLVQQVFGNILLNSIDASPAGAAVEVEVGRADEPGSVAVSFRDYGEGIDEDLIERLFEPYVTSKPNGVGLGLSVSKKIVEAHGGCIEVTSRPGEGATFTVVLPRRAGEEPAMVAA